MSKYIVALVIATAAAGCGDVPEPLVIPGPSAPGRVTTDQPFVWDSREELLDWAANGVTRGPITVEGEGAAAFIRVKLGVNEYVMRGPDLAPPASGVRGARVRARLRHDQRRAFLDVKGLDQQSIELVVTAIVGGTWALVGPCTTHRRPGSTATWKASSLEPKNIRPNQLPRRSPPKSNQVSTGRAQERAQLRPVRIERQSKYLFSGLTKCGVAVVGFIRT